MKSLFFLLMRFLIGFYSLIIAGDALSSIKYTDISLTLAQLVVQPEIILVTSFGLMAGIVFLAKSWKTLIICMKAVQDDRKVSASSLFESIVLVGLFIYFSIDRLFFMSIAFILTFIYGMSSYRSLQRDRFTGVYSDQK